MHVDVLLFSTILFCIILSDCHITNSVVPYCIHNVLYRLVAYGIVLHGATVLVCARNVISFQILLYDVIFCFAIQEYTDWIFIMISSSLLCCKRAEYTAPSVLYYSILT